MTAEVNDSPPPAGAAAATGADGTKRRVLLADRQRLLREALQALLEKAPGIEVVGAVTGAAETVRLAATLRPDVVLLDLPLEEHDGLAALREIKRSSPGTGALVLTGQDAEECVWAALQAGADGYVLKEASRSELLTAIDTVALGKRFISPTLSAQIVARYLHRGRARGALSAFDALTVREKQVMQLVAGGRRNREIAQSLCVSVKTVEKHRSNLMRKLKVHNTAALTSLALEKGLLAPAAPA